MTSCPALFISAPSSGSGKTSVTAAIARSHARRGERVRVFKTGPDFLDPGILERASGHAAYQLDLFMGGFEHCRALLAEASREADLILVEGVMGLFDGKPSSADLAAAFGLPVVCVIDASAMAQTFAALATGLARFLPELRHAGVIANRIGSAAHGRMLAEGLPDDLPLIAALPRDASLSLPERHLGLVQALEQPALRTQLDAWADAWEEGLRPGFAFQPIRFDSPQEPPPPRLLAGRRIAIARDAAFGFIYPANLDLLRALGAELAFFSPIGHEALPGCDALWLPGGYPELHGDALATHPTLAADLAAHVAAGRPLLAECGGMLALLDELTDADGRSHRMAGLLPGRARVQQRLAALGLQSLNWPEGPLRGHSFHYSTLETPLAPIARAGNPNGGSTAEALYQQGSLRASYVHHYFPSNPEAVAMWFGAAR
ncbi:cobyrinate a,c-diamide synthase [Roseateles saccharophilus]|uniref:Hydrogenobyrinic acid a,c-diamide synthase (Glutamine-hydrolysing) /cobyrinate a,c-diamide synthase n=1 Tax=Roseateles saccharophilus TaxID=304 RepID=A0A4R3UUK3_ROSSA|nr:cobyrinate a,c-diamide synthase [Roseateles saccharophilus]MDG0833262.1 cobyrinate a,c-diamide synthase [Roseateles saccharophilus]TCU94387.1 hydrogenobyrinic acid a,c-diamide synthase (glutamine-hydrolysing) /cobyrinate a,c-diamide synthase [Roseateles saccharophilus]